MSSGTYVRSIAHEMGQRLGCGAQLSELRRTAVGEFDEGSAVSLSQLEELVRQGKCPVIPPEELLPEFPSITLAAPASQGALHGSTVTVQSDARWVKLLDGSGRLLGIAERVSGVLFRPVVVFGPAPQDERPVREGDSAAGPDCLPNVPQGG